MFYKKSGFSLLKRGEPDTGLYLVYTVSWLRERHQRRASWAPPHCEHRQMLFSGAWTQEALTALLKDTETSQKSSSRGRNGPNSSGCMELWSVAGSGSPCGQKWLKASERKRKHALIYIVFLDAAVWKIHSYDVMYRFEAIQHTVQDMLCWNIMLY